MLDKRRSKKYAVDMRQPLKSPTPHARCPKAHKTHAEHYPPLVDQFGETYRVEYCPGFMTELDINNQMRRDELKEAKAQAKHARKLARIQRRSKFGFVL